MSADTKEPVYALIFHPWKGNPHPAGDGYEEATSNPKVIAAAQRQGLRATFGTRVELPPGEMSDGLGGSTIVWEQEPAPPPAGT